MGGGAFSLGSWDETQSPDFHLRSRLRAGSLNPKPYTITLNPIRGLWSWGKVWGFFKGGLGERVGGTKGFRCRESWSPSLRNQPFGRRESVIVGRSSLTSGSMPPATPTATPSVLESIHGSAMRTSAHADLTAKSHGGCFAKSQNIIVPISAI